MTLEQALHVAVAGLGGSNVITTIMRVSVGLLFYMSGSWKCFWSESRGRMYREMTARGLPFPCFTAWSVSIVELLAGLALILGLLTIPAAFALLVICLVACVTEPEPPQGSWLDKLGDWLFKPDVLIAGLLLVVLSNGSGPFSIDRLLSDWLRMVP